MPLINVVITLIVVGVLLWLVNAYIPMDGKIKQILNIVVVIAVVLWLLQIFGLIGAMRGVRVGEIPSNSNMPGIAAAVADFNLAPVPC